jgi:hypothetical protein
MTQRSDSIATLGETISGLVDLDANALCLQWRDQMGGSPPAHLPRWLLLRILAYRIQAAVLGSLDKETLRVLRQSRDRRPESSHARPFETRVPTTRDGANLRAGALLVRELNGKLERVMVLEKGFAWNGETYSSLSQIAKAMTGTSWNGHRFFGLRTTKSNRSAALDPREGFCNGAPVGDHHKVLPGASSLSVTRTAAEEIRVVCTKHRRGNRKSASR